MDGQAALLRACERAASERQAFDNWAKSQLNEIAKGDSMLAVQIVDTLSGKDKAFAKHAMRPTVGRRRRPRRTGVPFPGPARCDR
jgi:hypothetical protein